MLLVTHILPESPFNESETIGVGDVIVAINNKKISTIEQLEKIWNHEMNNSQSITLHMRDGSLSSATKESIIEAENVIKSEYKSDDYIKTSI